MSYMHSYWYRCHTPTSSNELKEVHLHHHERWIQHRCASLHPKESKGRADGPVHAYLSPTYAICLRSLSKLSFPTNLLVFASHSFLPSLCHVAISSTPLLRLCFHASIVRFHSVLSLFHDQLSFSPPSPTFSLSYLAFSTITSSLCLCFHGAISLFHVFLIVYLPQDIVSFVLVKMEVAWKRMLQTLP